MIFVLLFLTYFPCIKWSRCLQLFQIHSFLWSSHIPFVYMFRKFFIHLSVYGYLDYFHVLAIINNAVIKIGAQFFFFNCDFLMIYAH